MQNKTSLVTGASDGIGLECCKILAAKGSNLILVSRRQTLLDEIAATLKAQYPEINCTVIAADLAAPKAAQMLFQQVQEQGLEVDFLINNAGLLQNGFFTQLDLAAQESMINVNVLALTSLTHLFANHMASRTGGHILNVASLAAWTPIPNQNVYAATKAYVLSFTQALHDELNASKSGITVTALCPGYTATKMMDNPDQGGKLLVPAAMLQSPREVAEQGIEACLAGRPTIVTGLANRLTVALTRLLSRMTLAKIAGRYYRSNMQ